ncbi:pikB [Symbiodinium sp. KB8]|nr:pikB [Symbiodinium sp. KB8]
MHLLRLGSDPIAPPVPPARSSGKWWGEAAPGRLLGTLAAALGVDQEAFDALGAWLLRHAPLPRQGREWDHHLLAEAMDVVQGQGWRPLHVQAPSVGPLLPWDTAGVVSLQLLDAVGRAFDPAAPQAGHGVARVREDGGVLGVSLSAFALGQDPTPLPSPVLAPAPPPTPSLRSALRAASAGLARLHKTTSWRAASGSLAPPRAEAIPALALRLLDCEEAAFTNLPLSWMPGEDASAGLSAGALQLACAGEGATTPSSAPPPPPPKAPTALRLEPAASPPTSPSRRPAGPGSPTRTRRLQDSFAVGHKAATTVPFKTLSRAGSSHTPLQVSAVGGGARAPLSRAMTLSKPRLRGHTGDAGGAGEGSGFGAMLPNLFDTLFQSDPLHQMNSVQRAAVWQCRAAITHIPAALPKLLSSISWASRTSTREAHRLLYGWACFPRDRAARYLELLDQGHADQQVRAKAVAQLGGVGDEELAELIPQLVQALKFEAHLSSPLMMLLVSRAVAAPLAIGMPLYWCMEVEAGSNAPAFALFAHLLRAVTSQLPPLHRSLLSTQQALWGRQGAFARICEHVMLHKKAGKAKLKSIAQTALRALAVELPEKHVLPIDGRLEVGRLLVDKCRVMDSAKKPLWLVFENADPAVVGSDHPDAEVLVIFKAGDDIRQDTVVLQLIRTMDRLWKAEGLDLAMSPYRCLPTWHDGGFVEIVKASDTTANIQTTYGGTLGAYKETVFKEWLLEHNGPEGSPAYEAAVDRFIRSAAGYCVATYVLGIGDRHNDNIMIKKSGEYFHIDFGHFLAMAMVLGGTSAKPYTAFQRYAVRAFNILRENRDLLLTLFSLMVSCGLPELEAPSDIDYMRDMLLLTQESDEAAQHFKQLITESLNTKWAQHDDALHMIRHA